MMLPSFEVLRSGVTESFFIPRLEPLLRLAGDADVVEEMERVALAKHIVVLQVFAFAGELPHLAIDDRQRSGHRLFPRNPRLRREKDQTADCGNTFVRFHAQRKLRARFQFRKIPVNPVGLAIGLQHHLARGAAIDKQHRLPGHVIDRAEIVDQHSKAQIARDSLADTDGQQFRKALCIGQGQRSSHASLAVRQRNRGIARKIRRACAGNHGNALDIRGQALGTLRGVAKFADYAVPEKQPAVDKTVCSENLSSPRRIGLIEPIRAVCHHTRRRLRNGSKRE